MHSSLISNKKLVFVQLLPFFSDSCNKLIQEGGIHARNTNKKNSVELNRGIFLPWIDSLHCFLSVDGSVIELVAQDCKS